MQMYRFINFTKCFNIVFVCLTFFCTTMESSLAFISVHAQFVYFCVGEFNFCLSFIFK